MHDMTLYHFLFIPYNWLVVDFDVRYVAVK